MSSRSRKGKESDGSKPPGRDPHIPRCIPAASGPPPLHPCNTRANPAALPQRPLPHFPVGKIFRVKGGHAVSRGRVKTFLTPGEGARIPARRATHRTPAPKAGTVLCLSVVSFPRGFATIPAPFYGCGSCGKGSPGWTDHRTHPSHPCGPRCGPRRWPWFGCLA